MKNNKTKEKYLKNEGLMCEAKPYLLVGQIFGQVFDQIFGQGFGEGKNHQYNV